MTRIERTIRTRGYEMDASGVIPLSVLASYMEHVRWESIGEPDFPLRDYWRRGVMRAQRVELFETVRFGLELDIECWLARVGRTSLDLAHRVSRTDSRALVALAVVTVVNLGAEGRPAPLDEGILKLLSDGPLPNVEALAENAPPEAFVRRIEVAPSDQDVLQHVNHARYLDFVEDTHFFGARAGGYGPRSEQALKRARSVAISYEREASAGMLLEARSWPLASDPLAFGCELYREDDGELIARASVGVARS